MCTFITSSELLPERIHICVAGQCYLAHLEVHQNFNRHVQTHPFAEEMHGSRQDSFRRVQALDPSQHFSFVVVCLLLTWLQRLEGVTDAYILSVCHQGKHQSVYTVLHCTTLYKYYSSTTLYYKVLYRIHMKRHLQCAEQQESQSNCTKYCACHTK